MTFIQNIFYIVLTLAVPTLTTYICKFCYEKWSANKQAVENDHVRDILDQVISIALNCVVSVNQTFVEGLKKKGEFTEEAAKEAFNTCKGMMLEMLSAEAKKVITNVYGNVDVYLDTLIESTVNQVKQ